MRRTPIGHCWHGFTGLLCWMLWLVLGAMLAIQLFLLVGREIALPDFVRNQLRQALARQGLELNFKTATLDPGGVVVLDHVSLADSALSTEPLLTARALLIRVDPGWLITRRSDLRVEATGANLLLPAVVSPSGRSEPLVENAQFSVRLSGRHLDLHGFSARVGGAILTARGTLDLASAATDAAQLTSVSLHRILASALPAARHFVTITNQIRTTGDLIAHLTLDQRTLTLSALMPEARYQTPIAELPALKGIHASNVLARITLPLDAAADLRPATLAATLAMDTLELDGLGSGFGVAIEASAPSPLSHLSTAIPFSLQSPASNNQRLPLNNQHLTTNNQQPTTPPSPPYPLDQIKLNASVDRITARGDEVRSARLILRPRRSAGPSSPAACELRATLSSRWHDTIWVSTYDGRMDALDGSLAMTGALTPETLAALGQITRQPLERILKLTTPARLHARVALSPGAITGPAEGRIHARDVVAGGVPFDLASGRFTWDGARAFAVNDITLRQDDSIARGSYAMNTETLDFRFLLSGRLRPAAIGGWFSEWWSEFWEPFTFGPVPAAADVDVGGNWRQPHSVHVMVGVHGDAVTLRGVDLDRLHTRIFLRPTWYDILDFHGERAGHSASGRFDLSLPEIGAPWAKLNFDIQSTLPLPLAGALLGEDAVEQLADIKFENPPHLRAAGHVHRPPAAVNSPEPQTPSPKSGGETAPAYQLTLEADAAGPFTVHEFPLSDLSFSAAIDNTTIVLRRLRLGLADGTLEGPATVSGPADQRRLSIDQQLRDADLAALVLTIDQAIQRAHPPAPDPAPKKATAAKDNGENSVEAAANTRLKGGRLDLRLKGSGPLYDLLAFEGSGEADIRDAPLAQVSLLWHLSTLLKAAGLGFTSFNFDKGHGKFAIESRQVKFSELAFSGPSAEVRAEGAVMMENGRLDFRARLNPYEKSGGLLGTAADWVLSPFSTVLEFQLTGTLMDPEWVFRYGPRGLFRSLIGANRLEPTPPKNPPPPAE